MQKFEEQKFDIPELKGISKKTIEEHLKLYAGYVKHANLIMEHIETLANDADLPAAQGSAQAGKYAYELGELQRRFAFEFDGLRNHEYYFHSLETGERALPEKSPLKKELENTWGSLEKFLARFKAIALTRGIGWAFLYYDPKTKRLLNQWVDEQHLGHLAGLSPILALDMWEHSYVADYAPSGKKNYVEDFFVNLNWEAVENNYTAASRI